MFLFDCFGYRMLLLCPPKVRYRLGALSSVSKGLDRLWALSGFSIHQKVVIRNAIGPAVQAGGVQVLMLPAITYHVSLRLLFIQNAMIMPTEGSGSIIRRRCLFDKSCFHYHGMYRMFLRCSVFICYSLSTSSYPHSL